jgi:hypothetical protein
MMGAMERLAHEYRRSGPALKGFPKKDRASWRRLLPPSASARVGDAVLPRPREIRVRAEAVRLVGLGYKMDEVARILKIRPDRRDLFKRQYTPSVVPKPPGFR